MEDCYTFQSQQTIPIEPILTAEYATWLSKQPIAIQNWLAVNHFTAKDNQYVLCPNAEGKLDKVIVGVENWEERFIIASLPQRLPAAVYRISGVENQHILKRIQIAWGLGAYQFNKFKRIDAQKACAKLCIEDNTIAIEVNNYVSAHCLARDLISTPMEHLGPKQLADVAETVAATYGAKVSTIVGDKLLKQNYPLIHAVGRASSHEPRLIDLRWGNANHPKVTLIGKGVCFDSGGLDIKPSSGMLLMSKDMGGAAVVLALAKLIMANNLAVQLRVLIPAVENAISANSYRPGDIILSRSGKYIAITNTDAEGRLVLCDAITEAMTEKPDLLIDFATLTGAARVALGTEVPVYFTNDEIIAEQLQTISHETQDWLWRLPLFSDYHNELETPHADLANCSLSGYGGAITAALFLQDFVNKAVPWLHIDLMAWNIRNRPGRPIGGEAMGLQAIYNFIVSRMV